MKYKVKRIKKFALSSVYKVFYKKWYWLLWRDSGVSSDSRDLALKYVFDLYAGDKTK